MTITNTQATELSLDQLDDISAGFVGAAARLTAKISTNMAAKHGIRSAFKPSSVRSVYNISKAHLGMTGSNTKAALSNINDLYFLSPASTSQLAGLGAKFAGGAAAAGAGIAAIASNAGSIVSSVRGLF